MLQKFVNRARELEFLERHFKGGEAGFIVLYGRRRVGKTELINRFIKNKVSYVYRKILGAAVCSARPLG